MKRIPIDFYSPKAIDRIIAAADLPLILEEGVSETGAREGLRNDLNHYAYQLVRSMETPGHAAPAGVRGRPRNRGIAVFFNGLESVWMLDFGQQLRGGPDGPLVDFQEACCHELRSALQRGVDGVSENAALRVVDRLESRKRGLTRAALVKRMQRGEWLRLASDL